MSRYVRVNLSALNLCLCLSRSKKKTLKKKVLFEDRPDSESALVLSGARDQSRLCLLKGLCGS